VRSKRSLALGILILVILAVGVVLARGGVGEAAPGAERLARQVGLAGPREVPPEAAAMVSQGRYWGAAQLLRDYLAREPSPPAGAVLLAARAEAGSGDWERTATLLEGRDWLASREEGAGLFLRARAREATGDPRGALEDYLRYLEVAPPADGAVRVARFRAGLLQVAAGDPAEGEALLARAGAGDGALRSWTELLLTEALALAGDTAAVRQRASLGATGTIGTRARVAAVEAHVRAGDPAAAATLARELAAREGGAGPRAGLHLRAGRAALAAGDAAGARRDFLRAVETAPGSASAREAAAQVEGAGALAPAELLLLAPVHLRHDTPERAAQLYRAWLEARPGDASAPLVRMRLARAHFAAADYPAAGAALRDGPLPRDSTLQADFLMARVHYRSGNMDAASAAFLRIAEANPRTQLGAESLFLVADLAHDLLDLPRATALYRRLVREYPGRERSGLALMRVAGIAYQEGDLPGAISTWESYRSSHPRGQLWLQATYWSARAREESGDAAGARTLYRAVSSRDALSYYALLSRRRLGEDFLPPGLGSSPSSTTADRQEVERALAASDFLRAAGFAAEAEVEAERVASARGGEARLRYPLAEALNARGFTRPGLNLGLALQRAAGGRSNPRLLRILYPFPYRELVVAEARAQGLDPALSAALIRQESLFRAAATSHVGARGLMQVMPQTGREVAEGAGLRYFDAQQLWHPEVNVRIGTLYLAEQMREYDGSLPSVFSAYNAGPHRVERWSEFPEYGDEELFTERIPFQETRDYVKILTRNLALYRALYRETDG
jgi:soluble lytic murein transglycosylase